MNGRILIHIQDLLDVAVGTDELEAEQLREIRRLADEIALPAVLSVPKLLGLETLGIEWVGEYPDDADWLTSRLQLVHGNLARQGPGDTAKAMVQKSDVTVIFGHIHRIGGRRGRRRRRWEGW